MKNVTIGYEFIFDVAVKKVNGKIYKSHSIHGIGNDYDTALWDIYLKLKKKRSGIIEINKVRVHRIAYAIQDGKSIPLRLADCMPNIPDNLNSKIKYLPKI